MNELSNFITSDSVSKLDRPPYRINNSGAQAPISTRTAPASSLHFGNITENNAHNLYGLLESKATNHALINVTGRRPFILSRSTFVGSGKFTAHWTGDNAATWDDLAYSIPSMLSLGCLVSLWLEQIYVASLGTLLRSSVDVGSRWNLQLGAFYPFARDHSAKDTLRQELYLWDSVASAAKKALGLRYQLLPYLYMLMYEAHMRGTPIARPLFFSFPQDANAYQISSQFLLGKGVMVSPVLKQGAVSVDAYFPAGNWFSLFNYSNSLTITNGHYLTLEAPPDHINVHVREGNVLAMQGEALTTQAARETPFRLLVVLSCSENCTGEVFLDDGEDVEMGRVGWREVEFDTIQWIHSWKHSGGGGESRQCRVCFEQEMEARTSDILGIEWFCSVGLKSYELMINRGGNWIKNSTGKSSFEIGGQFAAVEISGISILMREEFRLKLNLSM